MEKFIYFKKLYVSMVLLIMDVISVSSLHYTDCPNSTRTFADSFGKISYKPVMNRETCSWIFAHNKTGSDFVLVLHGYFLDLKNQGQNRLDLPDGSPLSQRIRWNDGEICRIYVHNNATSRNCLKKVAEPYCSENYTLVTSWPPNITTKNNQNRMEFGFYYNQLLCSTENKTTLEIVTTEQHTGTIILSVFFILGIAAFVVLLFKFKKLSESQNINDKHIQLNETEEINEAYAEIDEIGNKTTNMTNSTRNTEKEVVANELYQSY